MNITLRLRQLEIFLEVQKSANISLAAKKLYLSQPAVSMAIAELEDILCVKLFDRHKNRLHINDNGLSLMPLAKNVLSAAEEIESMFTLRNKGAAGKLNIGATTTIASYLLPEMIKKYLSDHPNVHLSLEVKNTNDIICDLMEFNIDIGFIEGLCNTQELISIPWLKDSLTLFASPTHFLARQKNITLDMLKKAQWIIRESGSGNRNIFEKAIAGKLDNINVILELGDNETIKQTVKTGLGIGCMSRLALKQYFENGQLVEIKVPFFNFERNLYVLLHRDKYRSNLLKDFSESFLKSVSIPTSCMLVD